MKVRCIKLDSEFLRSHPTGDIEYKVVNKSNKRYRISPSLHGTGKWWAKDRFVVVEEVPETLRSSDCGMFCDVEAGEHAASCEYSKIVEAVGTNVSEDNGERFIIQWCKVGDYPESLQGASEKGQCEEWRAFLPPEPDRCPCDLLRGQCEYHR